MFRIQLADAIEKFSNIVQNVPDNELDRKWAWGAYDSEGVRFALFRTYEELRELSVEIATERRAKGIPLSAAQRILGGYHAAYRDLQAALLEVEPDEEERAPADDEWSPRQIVAHIVAAEAGFLVVVRYALDRHRSVDDRPAEIPEQAWDSVLGDEDTLRAKLEGPIAGMRAYHETLHERVLRELAHIDGEELAAPSMYWEGYEMSLRFRLHRFDSHLRQHTVQLDKTLSSIGRVRNEAQRLLRLIYAALADAESVTIGAWDVGADLAQETADSISARAEEIARILA